MARSGKIARLPREICEELNRRMRDNEPGGQSLAWLNGLPEVRHVLASDFGGSSISKQNLYEWRIGGYKNWLQQQEVLDMARQLSADTGELQPAGAQPLTEQMSVWLTARYLMAIRKLAARNPDGEPDLKVLREFCHDVVALRRGDHSGARLKIEQERLEREREKTEEEVVAQFEKWAKNQQLLDCICQNWKSPEERKRRLREIFGRPPEPPEETAPPCPGQTQ